MEITDLKTEIVAVPSKGPANSYSLGGRYLEGSSDSSSDH